MWRFAKGFGKVRRGSHDEDRPAQRHRRLVHNSGSMPEFKYVGSELDLFAAVHHWKSYWSTEIRRFIKGDVLEVGAGTGSNTPFLAAGHLGHFEKRSIASGPSTDFQN